MAVPKGLVGYLGLAKRSNPVAIQHNPNRRVGKSYMDAWIGALTGGLATHAVVNGKEALSWQNSTLPLGFTFTDDQRIGVQCNRNKWRFSVNDKAVQERTLVPPATSTMVAPALVTEDCRAAYTNIRAVKEVAK
jgi:hypothetical protein